MSLHRALLIFIIVAVAGSALLTIAQIWTIPAPVMDWATYTKLMITVGILVLLAAFVLVIKADLGEHKKLKDDNYID